MTFPDDTFPDVASSDLQSAYPAVHNAVKDAVETIEQRMVYNETRVTLNVATGFGAEATYSGSLAKRSTAAVYTLQTDETLLAATIRTTVDVGIYGVRLATANFGTTVGAPAAPSNGVVRVTQGDSYETDTAVAPLHVFLTDNGSGYPASGTVTVKLWIGRA